MATKRAFSPFPAGFAAALGSGLARAASAAILGMGITAAVAGTAHADVLLKANPAAPEAAVVASVYGSYLKSNPSIRVETAQVDLQGRGVASVVARFVSRDTCGTGGVCSTVVLFHDASGWRQVFSHATKSIDVTAPANLPGSNGMKSLSADGVRWIWTGLDHYLPDVESMGTRFPAAVPGDAAIGRAALAALVVNPDIKNSLLPLPTEWQVRKLDLDTRSPPAPSFLVRGYARGLCGATGCPQVLLTLAGGGYKALWSGFATGDGSVLAASSQQMRDIALDGMNGYLVLRFDGRAYVPVETSYPSPITPAP